MFEFVMFKYVHSAADGYLDCSCVWAVVNSAAIHICVQVLFRRLFQFFEYAFKSEILRLYGHPSFNLLPSFNHVLYGFPGGSDGKASTCNAGDLDSIPGSGGSPGEGNGNPLKYSCLENLIDRGAWWGTVHGVTKSQT